MSKAYWITAYREVSDDAALKRYAQLAGPAIESRGGRFLVRSAAAKAYEAGVMQRVVVIEFDSLQAAIDCYESPEYQAALAIVKDVAERDVRMVQGA